MYLVPTRTGEPKNLHGSIFAAKVNVKVPTWQDDFGRMQAGSRDERLISRKERFGNRKLRNIKDEYWEDEEE